MKLTADLVPAVLSTLLRVRCNSSSMTTPGINGRESPGIGTVKVVLTFQKDEAPRTAVLVTPASVRPKLLAMGGGGPARSSASGAWYRKLPSLLPAKNCAYCGAVPQVCPYPPITCMPKLWFVATGKS